MNLSPMVSAYLECALWTTDDEEGYALSNVPYTITDCAPELIAQAVEDCDDFYQCNADDLDASPQSFEQIGHDFWLTRNGHGAGFWDRGLGELGDRLTKAAKVYGRVDLYVGDDGRVYG